jgi:hypothetical protein
MRPETASQFGFYIGSGCNGNGIGQRNGDGLLDGLGGGFQYYQGEGETALFWQDISGSAAGSLIDGVFPNGGASEPVCAYGGAALVLSGTGVGTWFPAAKIGHGDYLYVYDNNGSNWFGLSQVTAVGSAGGMASTANVPVIEAYRMDAKIDDGVPNSGNVQANYLNNNSVVMFTAPATNTAGGNATSCYDTTTGTYSITYNNGSGGNCALSFKFQ